MTISVPCRRLDDMVPPDRPIGSIKIDVEGDEYDVLRGARRTLAQHRPIILFACVRDRPEAFGSSASQVFAFLNLYIIYHIFMISVWLSDGQPLALVRFEDSMVYPFKAFNYVAAPIALGHGEEDDARDSVSVFLDATTHLPARP
jgi:hypothetical protein